MTEHSIKPPHRLIGCSLHDDPISLVITSLHDALMMVYFLGDDIFGMIGM
jgi:hypothetical protein